MIGGLGAVRGLAQPDGGVVRMELDHGGPKGNSLGAVDLDLVVALRASCRGKHAQQRKGQNKGLQGAAEHGRTGAWSPAFHDCTGRLKRISRGG